VTLYYSLIYPHLNYYNIIWGSASASHINELVLLQKRAIRIVSKLNYLSHSNPLFKDLSILKMSDINLYCTTMFVYKCRNAYLPNICSQLLMQSSSRGEGIYNFRTVSDYVIPFYRTNVREKCIRVRGPKERSCLLVT
jgi:hypothetical protein